MPRSCSTIFSLLFNCIFLPIFPPLHCSPSLFSISECPKQSIGEITPNTGNLLRISSLWRTYKQKSAWLERTPSPLPFAHAPHLHIHKKAPLASPHLQTPPHSLISTRRALTQGNAGEQAACAGQDHTQQHQTQIHANAHKKKKKSIYALYKCAMAEETKKSKRELVSSSDVSAAPPSHPLSLPLLRRSPSPLIIRYLVTSGPW